MTCKSNKPLLILFLLACTATMHAKPVIFCGHEDNDLYGLMVDEGLEVKLFKSLDDALIPGEQDTDIRRTVFHRPEKEGEDVHRISVFNTGDEPP